MRYFFIALFLLTGGAAQSQSENPFMKAAHQEFADYCYLFYSCYAPIYALDSVESARILMQLHEAAQSTGNAEWVMEEKLMNYYYKLRMAAASEWTKGYTQAQAEADLLALCKEAQESQAVYTALRAQDVLREFYFYYNLNYEKEFECCMQFGKMLEDVTVDKCPFKPWYCLNIGNLYYFFEDYPTAAIFYRQALESEKAAYNRLRHKRMLRRVYQNNTLNAAYNGLGLVYRYGYKQLDSADYYFNKILQQAPPKGNEEQIKLHDVWTGIANGNLGKNCYDRGEYDKALPLLHYSASKMLEYNDYTYATGVVIVLSDIYLKKNKLAESKKYLDRAESYIEKASFEKASDLYVSLYSQLARYQITVGNRQQAMAYTDSAMRAQERHDEVFNALLLLRAEQKVNQLEQNAKNEELLSEKKRSASYRSNWIIVSIGLIIVAALLAVVETQYRKKRRAYRQLVYNFQQWALGFMNRPPAELLPAEIVDSNYTEVVGEQVPDKENGHANDELQHELIEKLQQLMNAEHLYKDQQVTLDTLAKHLNVNRVTLSRAINRCYGVNFSCFINEYRIKHAIRLLSERKNDNLSMEGIALNSGFNDRTTFYRAFRKVTGLSPVEFKRTRRS